MPAAAAARPAAEPGTAQQLRASFAHVASRPAQASAQSAQQPTGWATLRGRITIDGQAPSRQPLAVNKDTDVCAPGGKSVLSEAVVVAADGGIKDVLIFLQSDIPDQEPWTHASAQPGKSGLIDFDQEHCVFLTHVLAMQTTQTLNILNSDPVGHNTNMSPDRNTSFNSTIPVGGRGVYQPRTEERQPFPVTCSIHPWMQAWIIARDNSYFAVTKPDGSFEIRTCRPMWTWNSASGRRRVVLCQLPTSTERHRSCPRAVWSGG